MMDVRVTDEVLHYYFDNEARELRKLVDNIVRKNEFAWLSQAERDELYSDANLWFFNAATTWEEEKSKFGTFLYKCLDNKIKSSITAMNRLKRGGGTTEIVSVDEVIGEDGETTRGDLIASTYSVEGDAIGNYANEEEKSNAQRFMDSLSKTERKIVDMRLKKIPHDEIRSRLNLTKTQYAEYMASIKSADRKRLLTKNMVITREGTTPMANISEATTSEVSKETQYSAASICRQIRSNQINADHPQQRQSNQWTSIAQSDLIVTMLHGYTFPRIVLAEQTKNGSTVRWVVDGKQRVTTIADYREDGFKISKKSQRTLIKYKKLVYDENGKQVVKGGFPVVEDAEFDVKGKNYHQLPKELQEKIDDYQIGIDLYLHCNDDEVEYHILRFNQSKPMTVSQKGITHLGRETAMVVKDMTRLPFFADECGSYSKKEFASGAIDRVIIESVMAIYFLDDWKKSSTDAADFLKVHGTPKEFDGLERYLNRLADVATDEVKSMFTTKDTFLWLSTFAKFDELGIRGDDKFIEFMEQFKNELCNVPVDGTSYVDLCGNGKATKDKSVVKRKLSIIETVMRGYFNVEKEETIDEFEVGDKAEDYLLYFYESEFVSDVLPSVAENNLTRIAMQSLMLCSGQTDISDQNIQKNLTDYGDDLKETERNVLDYLEDMSVHSMDVKLPNEFYSERNIPAILAVYDYANRNEMNGVEFDEWIKRYAENYEVNRPFTRDIIHNRDVMIDDLKKFVEFINTYKTA